MSNRRKAANPGALTKSITYANGIFSVTTDLRAAVQAFGANRLHLMIDAFERELNTVKSKATTTKSRKIASQLDRTIKSQISEHVSRTINQFKATQTATRKLKAA